jgi:hypothetical protein
MTRTSVRFCLGVLTAVAGLLAAPWNDGTARADEPREIARVIVLGNCDTPDWAIRRCGRIRTGDKVREADLRAAEERLRAAGLFETGPDRGPSVTAVPNELDTKLFDLLIRVEEHPWNGVAWGVSDMWAAVRAQDPDAALRAAFFLKGGVARLRDWREEQRRADPGASPDRCEMRGFQFR